VSAHHSSRSNRAAPPLARGPEPHDRDYETSRQPSITTPYVSSKWYPAPNLDRALASSWVGHFYCLTQELVTRLNFGSPSAQAAPPLRSLLILLLTFCPGAAQRPQSHFTYTQSRFWALAIIGELCLACSCRPFEFFVNFTRRSGGSVLGPLGEMAHWILMHRASGLACCICLTTWRFLMLLMSGLLYLLSLPNISSPLEPFKSLWLWVRYQGGGPERFPLF
jgi:hypothetical protein